MAYGDQNDGTLYLYEVPQNLSNMQEGELDAIRDFWDNELRKCEFVKERRVRMKEEWD
jgi:hypothetical protein